MRNCEICKNCKHFIQYYTILGAQLHSIGVGHCGRKTSKATLNNENKACEHFILRDEKTWRADKVKKVLAFAENSCERMNGAIALLNFLSQEPQNE